MPKDKDLRNALVRNGTIPENRKVDAWLDGNSAGHHGGEGIVFPPIRLSNDIEIVFETPRPNCVVLRCADEASPFGQEKSGGVAAMTSDQVHAMAKDIVGQVLAGIDVDKADDKLLYNDKPLIVYEAVGADEVEIGEMYEVPEENDSEVEIVEEGEVILSEEDSDDAGFEAAKPWRPRPEREFNEYEGDDADEKADLEDEKWEEQKSLKTAQKAFGNCIPTDPTRCLTFHGYAKLSDMQRGAKRSSTESMTGQLLAQKWKDTKIENGIIYNESLLELSSSSFGSPESGTKKRKANDGHDHGPQRKRQRISFEVIEKKMKDMLNVVKKPLFVGGYGDNKGNYKRYLKHYENGLNDTREFLNFYIDSNNNNTLADSELGHMEAYELLYKQFVSIYGPNTSEECKDCSHNENMKVFHPY